MIVPELDAPFLPEMKKYNDVIAKSKEPTPPARSVDGNGNRARLRPFTWSEADEARVWRWCGERATGYGY